MATIATQTQSRYDRISSQNHCGGYDNYGKYKKKARLDNLKRKGGSKWAKAAATGCHYVRRWKRHYVNAGSFISKWNMDHLLLMKYSILPEKLQIRWYLASAAIKSWTPASLSRNSVSFWARSRVFLDVWLGCFQVCPQACLSDRKYIFPKTLKASNF